MVISKPQLTPIKGYVEVVDSNGNHVYKPTEETLENKRLNNNITNNTNDIVANKSDADEQLTNLQLALCETYEGSDKQLTDLQTALCEVYELVLGEGTV